MKKFIRGCLRYFGYDFMKVPATPIFKKDGTIRVGNYDIVLPANNPLLVTYREQTDFSTEIARLVSITYDKYPGLTFLDIGANAGDTVATVKSVKDIPVISIEGDEISFSYLEKNIKQFKNVTAINQFLGDKEQTLHVDLDKQGWNTTIIPKDEGSNTISIRTLDAVLKSRFNNIENIKILKIDTEGFDTIIIRGAGELLNKSRPVIYFEYNRDNMSAINEDGLSTIFSLEKLGYNKVLFYDDRGRFVLSTKLTDKQSIEQMHHYANGKNSLVYYYNICIFHADDNDIAEKVIVEEMQLF